MNEWQDRRKSDKTISVTFLFGLATQAAAIVWTVSVMMSDIKYNQQSIHALDKRITKVEDAVNRQEVKLARIDENVKAVLTELSRASSQHK